MIQKAIRAHLYDHLDFVDGSANDIWFGEIGGKIHPSLDVIFLVETRLLKHELIEIIYRDFLKDMHTHCQYNTCFMYFCNSDKENGLCDKHKTLIHQHFSGKIEFDLNFSLYCDSDKESALEQEVDKLVQDFIYQTKISAKIGSIVSQRTPTIPFWLVITENDYFHLPWKSSNGSYRIDQYRVINKNIKNMHAAFLVAPQKKALCYG